MRATHIIAASAIIATALSTTATTPVYLKASKPTEERVADLLSRMTLEEKAGQLLCPMGWEMYERRPDGSIAPSEKFREQNRGKIGRAHV